MDADKTLENFVIWAGKWLIAVPLAVFLGFFLLLIPLSMVYDLIKALFV